MSDADYYCDCIHCQPERYCDECGAVESQVGCPVCDGISHAVVVTGASGAPATLEMEYLDGDPVSFSGEIYDDIVSAIVTALHHEAPVIRLRVHGDPREVSA